MSAPLIELALQGKTFGARQILGPIALRMVPGEVVSLVGPSGCGKSTLLRILAGLERDYEGRATVCGMPPRLHSGHVGLVFQDPRLLPWLDVAGNVGFELGRAGRRDARVPLAHPRDRRDPAAASLAGEILSLLGDPPEGNSYSEILASATSGALIA